MRSPDELEREIAARKEAETALQQANAELERQVEALRASEERFRLLVDGTKDYAIFMLDPTGRIVSWNPAQSASSKYQAEEIVGQHFSRFYPPEDVAGRQARAELRVAAAEGRYEDEGWRLRKDGSRFWANVVITAPARRDRKPARLLQDHPRHDRAEASRGERSPLAPGGGGTSGRRRNAAAVHRASGSDCA